MRVDRRVRLPRPPRKKRNYAPGTPCARSCGRARKPYGVYCRPCANEMQRINKLGKPGDVAYSWRNQRRPKEATG